MGRIGKLRSHPLEIAKLELVGRQNLLNELIQKIQYVMKTGCLIKLQYVSSKLLFERRRLCGFRLSVSLSVCVCLSEKLFLLYGFGEQTSWILEFKPEGLEG